MTAPRKPLKIGADSAAWFTPALIATLRAGIVRAQSCGVYTEKFHANWLETALDAIEHLKLRPKRKKATR